MDEPLAMTIHLLANAGHGSHLQQALDQLLDCICPEVRIFLVSEWVRPVKYYEKYHPRRSRFPAISVLLFLQESLGEERLLRVMDCLQHSPWQCYSTQRARGRLCPYLLGNQEFYSLDNQMPVWGIRQVHSGAEILQVTLYCSFDNYEDAIRLYEMILQREATMQKSNFCFFVLHSSDSFTLQLSLKQLPPGMSVDQKEACALQFKVQEIGQLVPLLPNPCVPISSTRWQTQDYEGNKILLQVQLNPGPGVRNDPLGAGLLCLDSRLSPTSAQTTLEPRSRRSLARKFKMRSLNLPEPRGMSDSSVGSWWKSSGWSSQVSGTATGTQRYLEPGARMKILKEDSFQELEAETDVDTGLTVISSGLGRSLLSRFPRDLRISQPLFSLPGSSLEVAACTPRGDGMERGRPSSLASQGDFSASSILSKCSLHPSVQGEEKEEEFFI